MGWKAKRKKNERTTGVQQTCSRAHLLAMGKSKSRILKEWIGCDRMVAANLHMKTQSIDFD